MKDKRDRREENKAYYQKNKERCLANMRVYHAIYISEKKKPEAFLKREAYRRHLMLTGIKDRSLLK